MSNASSKDSPFKPGVRAVSGAPVVPWNPWLGTLFVIGLFFLSQFFSGLLLYLFTILAGWSHQRTLDWLSSAVSGQFFFVLLAEALLIGGLYLFLKQYKLGFRSIG